MQPILNYVSNFDAKKDYKFEFTYLGSEKIVTNEVEIRVDAINTEPIYKRQTTKFDKNHVLPAHVLSNGVSYKAKIRIMLEDGSWSVWSPEESFTCLATPNVIFENLEEEKYVYNNDVMFRAFFQQEQGDRVDTYRFVLLNSNKIPIKKFDVRRPETYSPSVMQERINNLEKGRLYYLSIYINTKAGVDFIATHEFVAHYVAPSTAGIIRAYNERSEGTVIVQSTISQNLGIQVAPNLVEDTESGIPFMPVDYVYLDNSKIIIPPHRPLMFSNLGMAQASDFIMKLWCENVPDGTFIEIQTENKNGVGLRLEKHEDVIIMVKEWLNEDGNGIKSRHRSNKIEGGIGRRGFYLYLKVIEFRPEIYVELIGPSGDGPKVSPSRLNEYSEGYLSFMNKNTKETGEMAINNLGLVAGSFVMDDPKTSYTPPTTSTSEAQLLLIRGALEEYKQSNSQSYYDLAKKATDALLKYYYPTDVIPSVPDEKWVPHWLVNVNAPFVSREWDTTKRVNFTNGIATVAIDKVVKVYSVRGVTATLENSWSPDAKVVGKSYDIKSSTIDSTGNSIKIELTEGYTGSALISYSQSTGPTIKVGDKCEAYPVWRPLDVGEIACAVDTLPWALDVFKLWYEITKESKWLNAINSTKASIVSASDVTNAIYYVKYGKDGEPFLKEGITNFTSREPKETYTNQGGLINIDYPKSTGEASFGTWVGNKVDFKDNQWIELKVGSDKPSQVTFFIDEDEQYDPEKRWATNILLTGSGLTKDKLQTVKLYNTDFYKANAIVWGIGYGKSDAGDVLKSGNSLAVKENIIESGKRVSKMTFRRGDEGGWLGWAQFMFGIWSYPLPFDISYKTDNEIDFVINDSADVKHVYRLPKTSGEYKTVSLTKELFGTEIAEGDYKSIVVDAIDESAVIYIDYIGFKRSFDKKYYTSVSFNYSLEDALKVSLEYIKPEPSRTELPYSPYVMPFDFHLINYEISDLRGAIYTGYQAPWIYQEGIFPDKETALNTNLQFLKDAQDAYEAQIGVKGFFAPIFWWDYRDDYGDNEPNTFGIEGNWGPVWGGFQYRTISDVARVFKTYPNNITAYNIFIDFIVAVDKLWGSDLKQFPNAFDAGKAPYNNQNDSQMVANFMKALISGSDSSRLTKENKDLIKKLLQKCIDYLDSQYIFPEVNSPVAGTWSPNVNDKIWYNYWGGEIIHAIALLKEYLKKIENNT